MSDRPPFERYPGSPQRDGASYRVISPLRDALAWVSVAGRLAVTSYLVREGDGWRDALPGGEDSSISDRSIWRLERRDPVELVFTTVAPDVAATSMVTVTREGCEIRLEGRVEPARIHEFIAVPAGTIVERDGSGVRVWFGGG